MIPRHRGWLLPGEKQCQSFLPLSTNRNDVGSKIQVETHHFFHSKLQQVSRHQPDLRVQFVLASPELLVVCRHPATRSASVCCAHNIESTNSFTCGHPRPKVFQCARFRRTCVDLHLILRPRDNRNGFFGKLQTPRRRPHPSPTLMHNAKPFSGAQLFPSGKQPKNIIEAHKSATSSPTRATSTDASKNIEIRVGWLAQTI